MIYCSRRAIFYSMFCLISHGGLVDNFNAILMLITVDDKPGTHLCERFLILGIRGFSELKNFGQASMLYNLVID